MVKQPIWQYTCSSRLQENNEVWSSEAGIAGMWSLIYLTKFIEKICDFCAALELFIWPTILKIFVTLYRVVYFTDYWVSWVNGQTVIFFFDKGQTVILYLFETALWWLCSVV